MSKLFRTIAVASLLLTVSVSVTSQNKRPLFNPDGSFWIVGNAPAGFLDFSAINLNGRRLRRLPSQGLQLNDGRTFHYKTLTVKRDNFSFTTETLRGVSYSFSGRFLRGGVFAELDLNDEQPVLEGTLTKFKNGKKVAEAKELKFSYFGGT